MPIATPTRPHSASAQRQMHRSGRRRLPVALYQAQRHQMALRQRRRLVRARAKFQQELNRALTARLQKRLGVTVCLDERYLARPVFMAQFSWGNHHWVLTYQAKPWGCDWFFRRTDGGAITQCTRQTLELELRHALRQLRRQPKMAVA